MNKQRCYWLNTRGLANAEMVKVRKVMIGSVQFSLSVVSDSLQPYGLQHTWVPYPSPFLVLTETHVRRVGDAIQPFHPLLPLSPPAFNLFQHQGLFQKVSSSHQVAKVMKVQLQHQSFQ